MNNEELIYPFRYKGHRLIVTKKRENYYTANYTVNGQEYYSGNSDIEKILKYFRSNVDKLMEKDMKKQTYEDIQKTWRGNRSIITYKDWKMFILAKERAKDKRVFYIGEFDKDRGYFPKKTSIESIHYDKVVSRFQRFVDEYCTDWVVFSDFQYKGYRVFINKEKNKDFYIGIVQFHKNSTFKHIADTREEVERCCKNRIGKVVYEKEKIQRKVLTPKQEKIQELEQLQARISAQLEELKKEKDTLTYKGVVLDCEQGKDDTWVFVGKIKNAPENIDVRTICGDSLDEIQRDFEEYIDWLEEKAYLYNQITGKKE